MGTSIKTIRYVYHSRGNHREAAEKSCVPFISPQIDAALCYAETAWREWSDDQRRK